MATHEYYPGLFLFIDRLLTFQVSGDNLLVYPVQSGVQSLPYYRQGRYGGGLSIVY